MEEVAALQEPFLFHGGRPDMSTYPRRDAVEIVGVAPAGFRGTTLDRFADLWVALGGYESVAAGIDGVVWSLHICNYAWFISRFYRVLPKCLHTSNALATPSSWKP
mgnify:CR=1 FL=1